MRQIRLAEPPKSSAFWRWHYAGEGCLSTIEAIYFTMLEYCDAVERVTGARPALLAHDDSQQPQPPPLQDLENLQDAQQQQQQQQQQQCTAQVPLEQLLYLFAQQRSAICGAYATNADLVQRPLPMTDAAKESHRLRRLQKPRNRSARAAAVAAAATSGDGSRVAQEGGSGGAGASAPAGADVGVAAVGDGSGGSSGDTGSAAGTCHPAQDGTSGEAVQCVPAKRTLEAAHGVNQRARDIGEKLAEHMVS
ncbi:hypothetical protein JKP88DRAFT_223211 [Tribonema minus]|uniref:Uncharacterized protein n=1 Tax=Tribonema minus TaxID=303371 RepID=A0A835YUR8_9STRA|nr:hypothetical protein JKP88DRAFT_223211 [Tribonema minus]